MATIDILAARAHRANNKTAEVIKKYASPERVEIITQHEASPGGLGLGNDSFRAQVLHAEMLAGLAEIVDELASSGRSSGQKKAPAKK